MHLKRMEARLKDYVSICIHCYVLLCIHIIIKVYSHRTQRCLRRKGKIMLAFDFLFCLC